MTTHGTTLRDGVRAISLLLLLACGATLGTACQEEQGPVDQVQTNLVDKAIFEGEWWHSNTVIDVDFDETNIIGSTGGSAPFTGSMSLDLGVDYNRGGTSVIGSPAYSLPIARVRWVIDEDFLFAYRSFELVEGGNDDGRGADFRGQPLAVYAIEDHVDLQQGYSSVTGETTNVREENTSDRRWYERQYMRVDWSRNRVSDFLVNDVTGSGLDQRIQREVDFFVQEGTTQDFPDSYRPTFVRVGEDEGYRFAGEWPEDAQDTVHYMSFVTQEVWSPGAGCLRGPGLCASTWVTQRNAFLRVPPEHEYAANTITHREFDRFGIIRSHQPTYARGGRDRETQHVFCLEDSDCGAGGACDTERNICVGGLTEDRGETDFLAFYASRHGLYGDSLTDDACVSDWECDGRYLTCDNAEDQERCDASLLARQGSVCDPSAKRCTIPVRDRPVRPLVYHLTPDYPPYLVRMTFEAVAQWNETLMRGRRAAQGRLPIDQLACDDESDEPSDERKGDGICTTDLRDAASVACQDDNPAEFCYCGSAEDVDGRCARAYDPFESPDQARARGVPNPYDCHVEGPGDEPLHPEAYADYDEGSYGYRFVGDECILTAVVNSCDLDPEAPCEELGDLRYQFLNFVDHAGAPFSGVSIPLSDPTNGELIVSNAAVAVEALESMATTASQLLPVLRGEASEDAYFSGENVRGYFARLGLVERSAAAAPSGTDGYTVSDVSRPASSTDTDQQFASARIPRAPSLGELDRRMHALQPKMDKLFGQEGRTAILSDRLVELKGTPIETRIDAALAADTAPAESLDPSQASAADQPISLAKGGALQRALQEHHQRSATGASRFHDDFSARLVNHQYWQFWADLFDGYSLAEASIRLQQILYRGIMVHEIGHSLGLEHNFAASLDRNHYHDPYFALAREMPLPGYLEYDSPARGGDDDGDITGPEAQRWEEDLRFVRQERLARGIGNVMTASVMDYHGDLSMFAGVGRYDAAAIMFSYFDRVEAYDTTDPTSFSGEIDPEAAASVGLDGLQHADDHRRELFTYYRGGQTCQSDRDCPHSAGRETVAFQPIQQRCVNNARTPNTTGSCADGGCICSNFHDDFGAYVNGRAYTSEPEYTPISYLYCNDNRTVDLSWCTRNDAGESFQEVVDGYRQRWVQAYPRVYFRNFSAYGPSRGYSFGGIVEAVKIFQHLFFRFNFEGNAFRNSIGPLSYADQLFASADVFNWLGEIIAAPDVGSYVLDGEGVYRQISGEPGAPGSELNLHPGQGFYMWSQYQEGLNGFNRLERAGTFYDKILAIESIAQRNWGLSFTIDERYYINFYDLFDTEVIDLFGGLILRNPKAYAPRVMDASDPDAPRIAYLSHYRSGDRGSNEATYPDPAIDGADSEVLRDVAAMQALATFPIFYDTSFEQRLLVFKTGSGDGYEIPATRSDGSPTCGHGEEGCDQPDFIVYQSDRLHQSYVAVVIQPNMESGIDEQQLGYQLLLRLKNFQAELQELQALDEPSESQRQRILELRLEIERDESFVEYLIELGRVFGISSYLY